MYSMVYNIYIYYIIYILSICICIYIYIHYILYYIFDTYCTCLSRYGWNMMTQAIWDGNGQITATRPAPKSWLLVKNPTKNRGNDHLFRLFFLVSVKRVFLAQFWGKFVINTLGYWGLYEPSPMIIPGMGETTCGTFWDHGMVWLIIFHGGIRGMWLW